MKLISKEVLGQAWRWMTFQGTLDSVVDDNEEEFLSFVLFMVSLS